MLQTRASSKSRRGIAALIALVCLSLATIVGTLLLQAALGEQRYLSRLELQSQGEWLVEAGFSRARARLAKSARYSGETWTIPGSTLGRTQNAIVRIAVRSDAASTSRRQVDVTATFSGLNEPSMAASRDF
jgi:type II secretory pathway component PulK